MSKTVLCLIGDLVASRKARERDALQRSLSDALKGLGTTSSAVSPYTITLGDEFQAVYTGAGTLFADLLAIMEAVHPQRVRFALGLGPLATPLNREQALGMDGPAFYRARDGIEALRHNGGVFLIHAGEELTAPEALALANDALALAGHILENARNAQRLRVLRLLHAGQSQKAIAEALGTSPANVSQHIDNGALEAVSRSLRHVSALLETTLRP